jgi:pantoate--beta-alanine ligase
MKVVSTIAELQAHDRNRSRFRVLVPTMGALHAGHVSLIRLARKRAGETGEVVVSIFVNPLQFEPGSDFSRYPRPETADEEVCRSEGVDLLFRPSANEKMYANDRSTIVEETALSKGLCGASRPGHFRGVCTVVTKLFHLLAPQAAVFGEKDFQQLAIISRMVRDLDFPIEIVPGPIVREADGLALSSRNQYLTGEERAQAPIIRQALLDAAHSPETTVSKVIGAVREKIESAPLARIDYVEIVGADDLQPRLIIESRSLLAVAVFFGKTRLIDNVLLR